jgi:hypothetical protein
MRTSVFRELLFNDRQLQVFGRETLDAFAIDRWRSRSGSLRDQLVGQSETVTHSSGRSATRAPS